MSYCTEAKITRITTDVIIIYSKYLIDANIIFTTTVIIASLDYLFVLNLNSYEWKQQNIQNPDALDLARSRHSGTLLTRISRPYIPICHFTI